MTIIGINASPRKTWNTATLLGKALDGAASQGAETVLVHLHDLDFTGCLSCFACKRKGGKSYGTCALDDELTPVLADARESAALVLASPNYLGAPTGTMKSFVERLAFPSIVYDAAMPSLLKKPIPTGFIYTMGSTDLRLTEMGYQQAPELMVKVLQMVFGSAELLMVTDTYQFDDYSKYVATRFDPIAKAKRREEHFPIDCEQAFEMGARLARAALDRP